MAAPSINLRRPGYLLGAAVVIHVGLISAQVTTATGVPLLEVATFGAFAEVQRVVASGVDGIRGVWSEYLDLRAVHEDNEQLRQQLQAVQVRLQEERAQAQRGDRLAQLLDLRERAGVETLAAEVIAGAAKPESKTVTIDKGASDGLSGDMAVLAATGVVGRIILPSPRAAMVQLIVDHSAALAALIERTRAQGLVVGTGTELLQMEYVPGTADVKIGDQVVTSGIDGIYPKGFVIGSVEKVDRGPGTFHEILVRPTVDFSRLEEVLVVLTPPPAREAGKGEPKD